MTEELNADVSANLDRSAVIEVRSVTKRFRSGPDTINAVDDASFSLYRGMFTALSGPSGSGKTTLLNLVLGWEQPDEGDVVGILDVPDWSSVSVVPQSLGLLPHLTLVENITMPSKVAGGARVTRGAAHDEHLRLMDALHITHLANRFPDETSLGEQQRAAIARALITAPRLLVADEPTSHQDELSTERIIDELVRAASAGTTILVATHDTRLTEPADVLLLIDDGVVTMTAVVAESAPM